MKIISLSEGAYTVDRTKVFVPFDETTDEIRNRPAGSLLVEIQPFLVITSRDVLLFDTGLGFVNDTGMPELHQLLMDQAINPSEVTKVLMSHLHKDHSGGLGYKKQGEPAGRLAFPNARYYVQQQELEQALKDSASYVAEDVQYLADSAQVELLNGNGVIDSYIRYEVTAAHSPHHQVFWVEEDGETVFFGGDDAPQYHQMKSRYVAKYDFDGKKCMELRQEWWAKGQEEGWTFLFYHDIKTPVMTP